MADDDKAIKLLQGYIWHPKKAIISLEDYLPKTLEGDVHVLWDLLPSAPFTFFDDGTLSATQKVYQFTVLKLAYEEAELTPLILAVSKTLQTALETTPESVGWQIFEDLREI